MKRTEQDLVAVSMALSDLVIATRDTTMDAHGIGVYLRNLDGCEAVDIVTACRTLEREATWFPKVNELLAAVRVAKADRERQQRRELINRANLLPMPQVAPERKRELMERIRQRVGAKALEEWKEQGNG